MLREGGVGGEAEGKNEKAAIESTNCGPEIPLWKDIGNWAQSLNPSFWWVGLANCCSAPAREEEDTEGRLGLVKGTACQLMRGEESSKDDTKGLQSAARRIRNNNEIVQLMEQVRMGRETTENDLSKTWRKNPHRRHVKKICTTTINGVKRWGKEVDTRISMIFFLACNITLSHLCKFKFCVSFFVVVVGRQWQQFDVHTNKMFIGNSTCPRRNVYKFCLENMIRFPGIRNRWRLDISISIISRHCQNCLYKAIL